MTTLAALKAEIISDINRPASDFTSVVESKISEALRFYARKRFYFNVIDATDIDLVVGQDRYNDDVVKSITRIDSAALIKTDYTRVLTRLYAEQIDAMIERDTDNDEPLYYSQSGQKIRVFPSPDVADTLRIFGEIKIAGPATDDEADNPWMVEAYDLIKYRAIWSLWANNFHGADTPEAQSAKQQEEEQLQTLIDETNKRHATGMIVPSEF